MSQLKTFLNLDPHFQQWASATAINTSNWTYSGTNATQIQLDKLHGELNPERTRFPSALKSSDYIYDGRFSWRSTITVAAGTFSLISNEFAFDAGMVPAVSLVYRAVAGLTLTMRVIVAPSIAGTDNASLNTDITADLNQQRRKNYFWDTTATRNLPLQTGATAPAVDWWRRIGVQGPKAPNGAGSLQVRIDVTDDSSSLPAYFDIGEFGVTGQGTLIHGVG